MNNTGNNTRGNVFTCGTCSAFFADHRNHLGDCVDVNSSPPREINRILNTAENVYSVEQPDGPIRGRASILGEEGSMQMRLASVFCSGCQTECGWKILGVSRHPVLRRGQFILEAAPHNGSQTRRAPGQEQD